MTMVGGALGLFDSHYAIKSSSWNEVDALFNFRFDSQAKKEEVLHDVASLNISSLKTEGEFEKDALKN